MLISEDYRQLNARMHVDKPQYGVSGKKYAGHVFALARDLKVGHILDYGCGKQTLKEAISDAFEVRGYDPAIPGLDAPPEPADLVACTDVLEHIEPDCLDAVLDDLLRVTRRVCYLVICTKAAEKHLADGRNAHLIVEGYEWWLPRLWARFDMLVAQKAGYEIVFIGTPKREAGCGHAH